MDTRFTRRRGLQEGDSNDADELNDPLVRQPIRIRKSNKSTAKDKMTSGLGDDTTIKESLNDSVPGKQSANDSKRKVEVSKPSNFASVHESYREDGHNSVHSEDDSEEDDSEGETLPTSAFSSSSRVPYSVDSKEGGNQPNLRSRKGEKSEFVYKPELRKANEKPPSWGKTKREVYSDDEEDQSKPAKANEKRTPSAEMRHEAYSDHEKDRLKPQAVKGNLWIPIFSLLVLVLVIASFWMLVLKKPSTHKAEEKLQVLTAFQDKFRKLEMIFSGQSLDLWRRSQRILELQLRNGDENQQPAIILLTAAQDAEQMLHCVGNQLAKIYASSFNSSYTVLSGLNITSEDSEEVKMDIDQRLSAGFQANNKVAVLHRLELLPPGSLIILYKYCDHENAAYKNVALVLTVLLKKATLQPDIDLKDLEETVYDYLRETFLNQVKPTMSHNEMDGDKLGGLWSRISHVVLPVLPGQSNVKECGGLNAGP